MKRLAFLSLAVMAMLVAGGMAATKLTRPATLAAAGPSVTISIQELHGQAHTSSLAVAEIVGP